MTNINKNIKSFVISAVFIGLAFVASKIKIIPMPYGGSVTFFSMLILSLPPYFFGWKVGLVSTFAYSLLKTVLGGYIYTPFQVVLDYILSYTIFFVVGFFNEKKYGLEKGLVLAAFLRLIFTCLSGYLFFKMYAPEGINPIIYTIIYNGSYIGVEVLITLVVLSVPKVKKLIEMGKSYQK